MNVIKLIPVFLVFNHVALAGVRGSVNNNDANIRNKICFFTL